MLEALINRSNAEPFFDGYTNKIIKSFFCKNHPAPKILHLSGKMNGVAKLSCSKGVITLINPSLNFKVEKVIPGKQGRFIILKLSLEENVLVVVNIYAPNDVAQQVPFFKSLNQQLEEFAQDTIVIGGDFNCALTSNDKRGGKPVSKNSAVFQEINM